MTIFVTWQLRVTLDSICKYCDVFYMCAPVVLLAESNIALFVFIIKKIHIGGDTF